MKNKEELYENIFKDKYAKLKNNLESLVTTIDETRNNNDIEIKKLEEEIEELKKNSIKAPELVFPENNKEIETLENKNKELKLELRKKIDLVQLLKSESKNILNDLQGVIKNLTKKEE